MNGEQFLEVMAKIAAPDVEARGLVGYLHTRSRFGATVKRVRNSELAPSISGVELLSPSHGLVAAAAMGALAINMPAYHTTWPESWAGEKASVFSIVPVPKLAYRHMIVPGEVTLYARVISSLPTGPAVTSHELNFYGEDRGCNPVILALSGCMRLPEAQYLFGIEGVSEEETAQILRDAMAGVGTRQLPLARAEKIVYGHVVGARLLDALLNGQLKRALRYHSHAGEQGNEKEFRAVQRKVLGLLADKVGKPWSDIEETARRNIVDKTISALTVPLAERAELFATKAGRSMPAPIINLGEDLPENI